MTTKLTQKSVRLIASLLLCLAPGLRAQTLWTGETDGDWGTSGNWDPSGVPAGNAELTFGSADRYTVDLGRVTRTIGAASFSESYTFNNGTLSSGATWTWTGGADETVTVNGILNNTAHRTIAGGNWVLSGNTTGSRLTLSGATLRLTGFGDNAAQTYLRNGSTLMYDKASTTGGMGNQVVAFESQGDPSTWRALQNMTVSGTTAVGGNASVVNEAASWTFSGNVQFSPGRTLTLDSTNDGVIRFNNWMGLDRDATGSITLNTKADVLLNQNDRGIRDHVSGNAGAVLSLIKDGEADLINVATVVNTYTGSTRIDAGNIEVQSMAQLGSSGDAAANLVFNGGGLRYAAEADQSSSRGFTVNAAGGRIEVREADTTLTLSGSTVGTGQLTTLGAGTLVLSGNSTMTGRTRVQAGTLKAETDSSLTSGTLQVDAGATLDLSALTSYTLGANQRLEGSGTVVGDLVVENGATLVPGSSPGRLSHTGGQTWSGGGVYEWEISGWNGTAGDTAGWDLIDINGGLTLAATQENPFVIEIGEYTLAGFEEGIKTFEILRASGGITGFSADMFTLDDSGWSQGGEWVISKNGNSLELTLIPEPGTQIL